MKLGIIELDHHLECLNSLCQILEKSSIEITVFTTSNLRDELLAYPFANRISWNVPDNDISSFIAKSKEGFESQDLLFFSTIESNFSAFNRLKLKVPRIIRIHNSNTFLGKSFKWNYRLTPYWLFKDASYIGRKVLLEREITERKQFVKESQKVCFTSDEITEFVKSNDAFLFASKIIDAVPITFNELDPREISEVKTIAVIGTIDRKRKDYHFLLKAFSNISNKLNKPITLKFMGRPKGKFGLEVLNDFKKIENNILKIESWKDGLSQNLFDKEIQSVDLIVAPIIANTKYFLWKEKYGFTKISGSINDCIKYGKKGLIPEFYPVPTKAKTLFDNYTNQKDFESVVLEYVNGERKIDIDSKALSSFLINDIGKKVESQFLNILTGFNS